ncbi:MAG: molybdopterin molybdenumtransferase MoeA, partial [Actinobacteria bacterium]|nr:molybdopterin molybdenumtransferase MoeA [Actinomycetota bacterium]
MLEVDEARSRILDGFSPLPAVEVPVRDGAGMVLTEDLFAPHALPRFDNSAMDGYAVRRSDVLQVPAPLVIAGEVRAGDRSDEVLAPGTALRVMTGAPIPP